MSSVASVSSMQSSFFLNAAKNIVAQSGANRTAPTSKADESSASVVISQAAREAIAASKSSPESNAVEAKLAEIKAKDAMSRTPEDMEYLIANDKKYAAILDKQGVGVTAAEVDYMQKAGGAVNSFALLSPAEKELYDKAVASGNSEAAAGISIIAFTRTLGHSAAGKDGATYDPINTEITPANIEKYFRHSISDTSGKSPSQLQALIQFLQTDQATANS